jgi:hypothetical protein
VVDAAVLTVGATVVRSGSVATVVEVVASPPQPASANSTSAVIDRAVIDRALIDRTLIDRVVIALIAPSRRRPLSQSAAAGDVGQVGTMSPGCGPNARLVRQQRRAVASIAPPAPRPPLASRLEWCFRFRPTIP